MVIRSTLKVPLFLVGLSLAIAACGSESDAGPTVDSPDKVDDPEPSEGGAPAAEPEPPGGGEAAAPEPEPSGGGKAGGGGGSEPEPSAGAKGEPVPGAGGAGEEEPEPEPEPPSEAELRGEELVKENGCVSCHQQNFAGFSVFPNITPDMTTGIGAWSDEQIIGAIRDGIDADGASMCPTMARYPFDDEQAADIVAFLRALAPVSSKAASACPGHG